METAAFTTFHSPSCTRAVVLRLSSSSSASRVHLLTRHSHGVKLLPRHLSFCACCIAPSLPVEESKQHINDFTSSPGFRKFKEATQKGNLVPLFRRVFSDQLTPVLAYRCLVKEGDCEAPSFLLESGENSETGNNVGRYSMLGAQPALEVIAKGKMVTILNHEKGSIVEQVMEDPLKIPAEITSKWTPVADEALPNMFCGGWIGFFSYDAVRYTEKKKLPIELAPTDDRHLPDIHLGLYKEVVVFDHVAKGKITSRPLAGTRRRGQSQEEDLMLEKELLKDEKECAEHIMLVDLSRNDVGKVAKAGSVKVEELMGVVRYSHVMHMSSTVTGEILEGLTSWDVLRAALPVGTVTGTPKVRAMELIDELEQTRRGPYSGGIGYISFTDDMDIALTLRTMVFLTAIRHNTMCTCVEATDRREWVVHLQAGAGIVADSNPEDEYKESLNKLAGLRCAIDLAESAFVPMALNKTSQ